MATRRIITEFSSAGADKVRAEFAAVDAAAAQAFTRLSRHLQAVPAELAAIETGVGRTKQSLGTLDANFRTLGATTDTLTRQMRAGFEDVRVQMGAVEEESHRFRSALATVGSAVAFLGPQGSLAAVQFAAMGLAASRFVPQGSAAATVLQKVGVGAGALNVGTSAVVGLTRLGTGLVGLTAIALGTAGALVGVGVAIKSAITFAADFEQALAELRAITGASGDDLAFLREQALELGRTTTTSALQVTEAFKLIASAKPELLEDAQALATVTKEAIALSEASGLALPEAARVLTTALNQFRVGAEEASRFINAMAAGAKLGAIEIPDLSIALVKAGTEARNAGLSFEQFNALLQRLGALGTPMEKIGTSLRNIFLEFAKSGQTAQQGIAALKAELGDLSPIARAAALTERFGNENATVAAQLLDVLASYQALTPAITATSVAYEQQRIRTDTFDGATKRLRGSLDELKQSFIADTGLLREFIELLNAAVHAAAALNKATGDIAPSALLGGLAFGPLGAGAGASFKALDDNTPAVGNVAQLDAFIEKWRGLFDALGLVQGASAFVQDNLVELTGGVEQAATAALQATVSGRALYTNYVELANAQRDLTAASYDAAAAQERLTDAQRQAIAAVQADIGSLEGQIAALREANALGLSSAEARAQAAAVAATAAAAEKGATREQLAAIHTLTLEKAKEERLAQDRDARTRKAESEREAVARKAIATDQRAAQQRQALLENVELLETRAGEQSLTTIGRIMQARDEDLQQFEAAARKKVATEEDLALLARGRAAIEQAAARAIQAVRDQALDRLDAEADATREHLALLEQVAAGYLTIEEAVVKLAGSEATRAVANERFDKDELARIRTKAEENARQRQQQEQLQRQIDEDARRFADPFVAAGRALEGSFEDVFFNIVRNGKVDFEHFADDVLDIFASMFAQLAVQALARPIIIPVIQAVAGGIFGGNSNVLNLVNQGLGLFNQQTGQAAGTLGDVSSSGGNLISTFGQLGSTALGLGKSLAGMVGGWFGAGGAAAAGGVAAAGSGAIGGGFGAGIVGVGGGTFAGLGSGTGFSVAGGATGAGAGAGMTAGLGGMAASAALYGGILLAVVGAIMTAVAIEAANQSKSALNTHQYWKQVRSGVGILGWIGNFAPAGSLAGLATGAGVAGGGQAAFESMYGLTHGKVTATGIGVAIHDPVGFVLSLLAHVPTQGTALRKGTEEFFEDKEGAIPFFNVNSGSFDRTIGQAQARTWMQAHPEIDSDTGWQLGMQDFIDQQTESIGLTEQQTLSFKGLAIALLAFQTGGQKGLASIDEHVLGDLAAIVGNINIKGLDAASAMDILQKAIENLGPPQLVFNQLAGALEAGTLSAENYEDAVVGLVTVLGGDLPAGVHADQVALEELNKVAAGTALNFETIKQRLETITRAATTALPVFQQLTDALKTDLSQFFLKDPITGQVTLEIDPAALDTLHDQIVNAFREAAIQGLTDAILRTAFNAAVFEPLQAAVDAAVKGVLEETKTPEQAATEIASVASLLPGMIDQLEPVWRVLITTSNEVDRAFRRMTTSAGGATPEAEQRATAFGFNIEIQRQIVAFGDEVALAFAQLNADQQTRLDAAKAVGADLVEVERLNGLERAKLLEELGKDELSQLEDVAKRRAQIYARQREQAEREMATLRDFVASQRGGTASPFDPTVVLPQAQARFAELLARARGGDLEAARELPEAFGDLRAAAERVFGRTEGFFTLFNAGLADVESVLGVSFTQLSAGDQAIIDELDAQTAQLHADLQKLAALGAVPGTSGSAGLPGGAQFGLSASGQAQLAATLAGLTAGGDTDRALKRILSVGFATAEQYGMNPELTALITKLWPEATTDAQRTAIVAALVAKIAQPGTFQPLLGFASGAIVTREMVARVGEGGPEAVLPLSRLAAMLEGAFSHALAGLVEPRTAGASLEVQRLLAQMAPVAQSGGRAAFGGVGPAFGDGVGLGRLVDGLDALRRGFDAEGRNTLLREIGRTLGRTRGDLTDVLGRLVRAQGETQRRLDTIDRTLRDLLAGPGPMGAR